MRVVVSLALVAAAFATSCSSSTPEGSVPSSSASASTTPRHAHKGRKVTRPRGPLQLSSEPHDLAHAEIQNVRDEDERAILANGAYCRVQVPPSGPISLDHVEYEYEEVDCPPAYDDPAWDQCTTTIFKEPKGCFCTPESDEPPSPPSIVDCPAPP